MGVGVRFRLSALGLLLMQMLMRQFPKRMVGLGWALPKLVLPRISI
jgi:hypothetical protein